MILGLFPHLASMSSSAVNTVYRFLFEHLCSVSLGIYPGVELLGNLIITENLIVTFECHVQIT
jgi:hypothetical protein